MKKTCLTRWWTGADPSRIILTWRSLAGYQCERVEVISFSGSACRPQRLNTSITSATFPITTLQNAFKYRFWDIHCSDDIHMEKLKPFRVTEDHCWESFLLPGKMNEVCQFHYVAGGGAPDVIQFFGQLCVNLQWAPLLMYPANICGYNSWKTALAFRVSEPMEMKQILLLFGVYGPSCLAI